MDRRRLTAGAAALSAAACAALAAAPPASADPAAFTCDRTVAGNKSRGWGYGNCTGPKGFPLPEPIKGDFTITSRHQGDPAFTCSETPPDFFPSGHAELPRRVVGFHCNPGQV